MENINIPEGYQQVMPYLILQNAAGFISFMQAVFGAEEKLKTMRDGNLIMHAEITLGNSIIMLADATDEYGVQNAGMFIYVNNCDDTYHNAVSSGAVSVMEPADQPYGRSAGIVDAFGNTWWVTSSNSAL
jgi:PhnB protein